MNHRQRIADTIVATISAAALALGAAPAAFASDTPSPAERTAAVIEKATGTTDIATAPTPGTTIPQRSTGNAQAGTAMGDTVSITLPGTQNVTGTKAGKNTTVYLGAAKATDLAVQPTTDGGIRTLAVLKDATAPPANSATPSACPTAPAWSNWTTARSPPSPRTARSSAVSTPPGPRTPTATPYPPTTGWRAAPSSNRYEPRTPRHSLSSPTPSGGTRPKRSRAASSTTPGVP